MVSGLKDFVMSKSEAFSCKNKLFLSFHFIGLDKIEFLQSHEIKEIYQKSFFIIEQYFGSEEEDTRVAPSSDNNQYQFNADQSVPMGGYQF